MFTSKLYARGIFSTGMLVRRERGREDDGAPCPLRKRRARGPPRRLVKGQVGILAEPVREARTERRTAWCNQNGVQGRSL
jgi:hypothetical protein